ncbi:hypothetical protein ABKW28_19260 [Nocardioides sp. 31GB23]|uniref:hypothetical protein n=1 Tax=Nocardioides sp. 31GB23 TaxID=3156065 RepID=UPI0032AE92C1
MTDDQTLADTTPPAAHESPAGGVFGDPTAAPLQPPTVRRQWSIADILAEARVPERYARVCLRADLEADHERILTELRTLIDVEGNIIEAEDASLGEETNTARAHRLNDELEQIKADMAKATWWPRFRGMTSDEFAVFNKEHYPKKDGASLEDYNNQLVAATMHEPQVTPDEVAALRKKLGMKAMSNLIVKATEVNTQGGVDVPKSPSSLQNLTRQ